MTIYDSSEYHKLQQHVITICDKWVIKTHDNCYYNLRKVLQFMTLLQFTTAQKLQCQKYYAQSETKQLNECFCNWSLKRCFPELLVNIHHADFMARFN